MKLKTFFAIALLLSVGFATARAALFSFYDRYEAMAVQLEKSSPYDADTANAIKHAKASADVFNLLRAFMPDSMAEGSVILMGYMNEYLEQVLYAEDADTALEIMKDLHNNYVGIAAARLAEDADVYSLIISFADNRALIVKDIYNPLFEGKEPQDHIVSFGRHWFNENRAEIDKRIAWKFEGTKEFLVAGQNLPIKISQRL